jgi:hypothetical protein
MKTEPARSPEFAKFDALVGRVLSVPKAEIQRMKAEEKAPKRKPPAKAK